MTQIVPWSDAGDLEPVDLEGDAQRALQRLRSDPSGERLAEMLPDMLLIGVSYVGDLYVLMKRYRRSAAEMWRRQDEREAARRAAPGIAAHTEPREEEQGP